jgi:uncharacterized damage-inducible protein DinB
MTAAELRTHLRYSTWASRRVLDAVLKLDPEQQTRDLGCSHKGLLDTLRHIHFGDSIWLTRIQGEQYRPPSDAIEIDWPRVHAAWERWSDSLNDAGVNRLVGYKDMKGNPYETPVWQICLHVVNHATLHRGQVMAMLRQLGVPPPPTDLIFYYRESSRENSREQK